MFNTAVYRYIQNLEKTMARLMKYGKIFYVERKLPRDFLALKDRKCIHVL